MSTERIFTLAEAQLELPHVRAQLQLMREALAYLRKVSATASPDGEAPGDADRPMPPLYSAALRQLSDAQLRLSRIGVQLKDVDQGLVDFPARDGDHPILLCWREGEDGVEWFHDLESGFPGRRPVSELRPAT